MSAIFFSYRRHDSEGEAGRLFDDLVEQFGETSVFMDVAAIEVGRDFRKAVDASIANCAVLLAIIGLGWVDEKNDSGLRRLDDPNDLVRMEIASALKRDIPVIPVIVHGAKMPRPDQMPEEIRDLAYRNAVELTHVRWKSDIRHLIRALRLLLSDTRDIVPAREVMATTDSRLAKPTLRKAIDPAEGVGEDPTADLMLHGTGESGNALGVPPPGQVRSTHDASASNPNAAAGRPDSNVTRVAPESQSPPVVPGIVGIRLASVAKPDSASACAGEIDPDTIARIATELADYIGPIAEIVVKRAAKRCVTVADLRRMVADEIETTAERTKFLDACQSS